MGCASSGPVKDLAAAATNGASENVKTSLNNAMEDAANLDFDKAQEDLKQVGEGLKDAVVDGVNDMVDDFLGNEKNSLDIREEADGGSVEENAEEVADEGDTQPEEQTTETTEAEEEQGLDSIRKDDEAEAEAMEVLEKEPTAETETETTEEAPTVVDAGDMEKEG